MSENNDQPILSVITVVRNCVDTIENTILSVINQSYSNIEYIVIDGNSSDGTKEVINKYKDQIYLFVSENDDGIYDAMNKGINNANGKFVNFMNAGDIFFNNNICQLFADQILTKQYDVFYGDVIAKSEIDNLEIVVKAKPINKIYSGMIFCHQSSFIKLSNLKETPFDLKYNIVADYNQILSLYFKKKTFCYIENVMAKVIIGGVSYSNPNTIIQQIKVVHSNKPYSIYILDLVLPLLLSLVRVLIGNTISSKLRKLKWKFLR